MVEIHFGSFKKTTNRATRFGHAKTSFFRKVERGIWQGARLLGRSSGLARFGVLKGARPEPRVVQRGHDRLSGNGVRMVADKGSARQNPDELDALDSFEQRARPFFIVFVVHVGNGEIKFRDLGGV